MYGLKGKQQGPHFDCSRGSPALSQISDLYLNNQNTFYFFKVGNSRNAFYCASQLRVELINCFSCGMLSESHGGCVSVATTSADRAIAIL